MFAAAPPPPPGPSHGFQTNGYSTGSANYPDAPTNGHPSDQPSTGRGGSYPAIAEIVASAEEQLNKYKPLPINRLLDQAKVHYNRAVSNLDVRSSASASPVAAAYWDYLVAYHIVVKAVPEHRDFYDRIQLSRNQAHRDYLQLTKQIGGSEERFKKIKDIIVNDNKRNGSAHIPSASADLYPTSSRPTSRPTGYRRDDELMLPDAPSDTPPNGLRQKPPVQPKPESLHGHALQSNRQSVDASTYQDDLVARFAKLSSGHRHSVTMPSPADYQSSSRPLGPRDLPGAYPQAHGHGYSLSLNTNIPAAMPKQPSPTYSPARNLSQPESINPPRSTARSMVGTGGRMQASSASAHPPNADGNTGSYFPPLSEHREPPSTRRHSSVNKPAEEQIPVEKLYDYLRMYKVLLIDVRSREEFDEGHIWAAAVMCIEPTSIHDGCSAEQLQDRLILSPDEEQAMFDRRNEYDLIVYYDQCTKTSGFLQKHNPSEEEKYLKWLYTILHEYNDEKPLQRPPIFLMGGLEAWKDMLGEQALKTSSTSVVVRSKQTVPSRGLRRATAVTHGRPPNLHKRTLREYEPMDSDEAKKWIAEAREGRAVFDTAEGDASDDALPSPMYHSTEEFLRRYPDVEAEPQSMVYPPRRPPPPPPPLPLPPPPPPQHAPPAIPVAPSRPAPSVPRVSYGGVHERQIAAQAHTAQQPVHMSYGRYPQVKLHKTGLINFGVTCYMNSVVQSLCGNADLVQLFYFHEYTKYLQMDNYKGTRGILSESFETLLSNLFKGDVNSCRPSTFRRACGRFNSQWIADEQQDAKEFLDFVLDNLHEDLNIAWNKSPLKPLTEQEEAIREGFPRPYAAKLEWDRYIHRDRSLIIDYFGGQHASQLQCTHCGQTSTTYEAFTSISVEIPRNRPGGIRECLESFCGYEHLPANQGWRCPRCKCERDAKKKITITRAPDYLTVHFKRFTASHHERARKIQSPIDFPLRRLDLGPFMEPPITTEQEVEVAKGALDGPTQLAMLKTDRAMNGPYIYNAYAVIWHIGNSLSSGHYITHVKDKSRGCWRRFNDDRTTDFDPGNLRDYDRLQNDKAYIVFYERERVAGGAF